MSIGQLETYGTEKLETIIETTLEIIVKTFKKPTNNNKNISV